MFEVRSSSRLRGGILCFVLLLCCFARGEKCAKEGGGRRKCGGRHYKLTSLMARAAELPVGTLVCRVHWDEIRRQNERCSAPRASHSRCIRKRLIPSRLFPVLDAVGKDTEGYSPGTKWCTECSAKIDNEATFTSRPEYIPPGPPGSCKEQVSLLIMSRIN